MSFQGYCFVAATFQKRSEVLGPQLKNSKPARAARTTARAINIYDRISATTQPGQTIQLRRQGPGHATPSSGPCFSGHSISLNISPRGSVPPGPHPRALLAGYISPAGSRIQKRRFHASMAARPAAGRTRGPDLFIFSHCHLLQSRNGCVGPHSGPSCTRACPHG